MRGYYFVEMVIWIMKALIYSLAVFIFEIGLFGLILVNPFYLSVAFVLVEMNLRGKIREYILVYVSSKEEESTNSCEENVEEIE